MQKQGFWPQPRFVIVWPFHSPVIARSGCRYGDWLWDGFHWEIELSTGNGMDFPKSWMQLNPWLMNFQEKSSSVFAVSCKKGDDKSKGFLPSLSCGSQKRER
jgi:hypothetical protein